MPRPKEFGLLRPEDRTWIGYLKNRYKNEQALEPRDRKHLFDIRERVRTVLQDLVILAQKLPEDQQEQIFTEESLEPLVVNLLGWELKDRKTDRHYQLADLFATYGLNVCQDRITGRNPDAVRLILRAFNDARELIQLVTAEESYDKETRKMSLRPPKRSNLRKPLS
jgi:hypothetical protein